MVMCTVYKTEVRHATAMEGKVWVGLGLVPVMQQKVEPRYQKSGSYFPLAETFAN
jgi:hypothetical protein